jgi:hypothetical protein
MDKHTKLRWNSYNTLRTDAAQKLRDADRLGAQVAAKVIVAALPASATLRLTESDQSIDFEWDLGDILDADGNVIADIDSDSIVLTDGTVIPLNDDLMVHTVLTDLPQTIPLISGATGDAPATEYTSWFQPNGSTALIHLAPAASDES